MEIESTHANLILGSPWPTSLHEEMPGEVLAKALADALSIESLCFTMSGIFDGYSLLLFDTWLRAVGPLPYTPEIHELVYEKARIGLEEVVEVVGEDGLELILSLPFKGNVSPEEELAAREALERLFAGRGLTVDGLVENLVLMARARGEGVGKALAAIIAHVINRGLNEALAISRGGSTLG